MSKPGKRVAVLMGGPSAEREVSLVTGAECAAAARRAGYEVTEIDAGPDLVERLRAARPDVALNALHGRWGEDGCVQGLLEWLRLPYTNSGVAASALAMDKPRAKDVFAAAGLTVAPHVPASPAEIAARHVMAPPYVVKPANEGSSVGVRLVLDADAAPPDLTAADAPARLMVERYVPGRELTVAVHDDAPLTVTEIFAEGWYDYDAKYKPGGSRHVLPADVPEAVAEAALAAALTAHRALGCRGVTRADFRYDERAPGGINEKITILEVNTQPGMTPTSLVPEQAEARGISFEALVAWMIEDASTDR
ncbi:MAG: D-alanine--D-alanine ligase [Pseudomonadota bacterium]